MSETIRLKCPSAKECDDKKCPHRKKHEERESCKTSPCYHKGYPFEAKMGCCCVKLPEKDKP